MTPGHWLSERSGRGARRVLDLRGAAALGLDTFHLGGNSMGGFIAAEFAARHAHRVASLWLLDAAGTAAAQDTPMVRHYLEGGEFPLLLKSTDGIGPLLKAIASRPPLLPPSVKTVLAVVSQDVVPVEAEAGGWRLV